MSDFQEKLKTTIFEIELTGCDWHDGDDCKDCNVITNRLTEAISHLIDQEIIGEDRLVDDGKSRMTPDGKRSEFEKVITVAQNALKAEQRLRLKGGEHE